MARIMGQKILPKARHILCQKPSILPKKIKAVWICQDTCCPSGSVPASSAGRSSLYSALVRLEGHSLGNWLGSDQNLPEKKWIKLTGDR